MKSWNGGNSSPNKKKKKKKQPKREREREGKKWTGHKTIYSLDKRVNVQFAFVRTLYSAT